MAIPPVLQAKLWSVLAISIPVVVEDVRTRRIPNWACGLLFLCGLAEGALHGGAAGFLSALGGAAVGFAVFLVFHLRGGMGAGDVKLMAACGAITGIPGVFTAAVLTAIAGAFIALVALARGLIRNKPGKSIAYGPAIVLGSLATLLGQMR
jgi:prepilin peptidase CpaA